MSFAVALSLCAALAFCLCGATIARRLPPASATVMLAVGNVLVAAATVAVLAAIAFTAVAQLPQVATAGDWSSQILSATDPVPIWVAIACGLVLVPAAIALARALTIRARALSQWYRMCWGMEHVGRMIVVDNERPEAFATPVGRGRIIVSTGMLRALPADERAALLAHERSHVSRGHSWWLMAADLAAAVNPLLTTNARAARDTAERWADEDAADVVGDRELVARSLARAALVSADTHPRPVSALAATSGRVGDRVRALLVAPPKFRLLPAVLLIILTGTTVGSAYVTLHHTDTFFDHASVATGERD